MGRESRDLQAARVLLEEFERDMTSPDGKAKLAEAVDLLVAVWEGGASEDERRVARNLAQTYGTKVVARARALLDADSEPPIPAFRQWRELLGEFARTGVASEGVNAARADLIQRILAREISGMSASELEASLEEIQAELAKRRTQLSA